MADAHAHQEDHGHSPAAWTGVLIILVATALICLGMILEIQIMWIVGIVGVAVGALAWMIMGRSAKAKTRPTGATRG